MSAWRIEFNAIVKLFKVARWHYEALYREVPFVSLSIVITSIYPNTKAASYSIAASRKGGVQAILNKENNCDFQLTHRDTLLWNSASALFYVEIRRGVKYLFLP